MKEDKRNRGFPNLDKYLKDRGRKLVNYEEGAEIYGIPYYSFVRLAKEAEATFTLRKTAVADMLHHEEGITLIPANIELAGLEVTLINVMSREMILKNYVDEIRDWFDYILIDCMPSLGMLTVNALVAADSVIIPCQTSYLPVKGLQQLLATISKVRRALNRDLRVEGILLTMVDMRNVFTRDMIVRMHETYGTDPNVGTFETYIPRSVRAEETSAEGLSIFKTRPDCKVAMAYTGVAKEPNRLHL